MALLTADVRSPSINVDECAHHISQERDGACASNGREGESWREKTEDQPLDGMLERLSEGSGAKLSSVPVRAQAELLARLKPLQFDDGMVIMAKGTQPSSIFFVRSGAVTVSVRALTCSKLHSHADGLTLIGLSFAIIAGAFKGMGAHHDWHCLYFRHAYDMIPVTSCTLMYEPLIIWSFTSHEKHVY